MAYSNCTQKCTAVCTAYYAYILREQQSIFSRQNLTITSNTDDAQGLMVITLCNVVTWLSALSLSAISSNGKISGGGVYYVISR